MGHLTSALLRGLFLLLVTHSVFAMVLFNATDLGILLEKYLDDDGDWMVERQRSKRAITASDMQAILDLHNKLRGKVYPQASNMEYMVWDTELERSAQEWAETCLWEHGPAGLLPQIGQNLGVHWGRYRPPTSHVQAWYDEVKDYSFPYPQECNPHCPFTCSGPVCTHYTQLVWATSSRIGCAINVCYNMNVWGQIWAKAVYLVCNYSPKGNWWGYAPYKHGTPCSACPPSYGGIQSPREETDERNSIEPEAPHSPGPRLQAPSPTRRPNAVVSKEQMSQIVTCDTKLRDQCKGTTCNRYECPAGCLGSMAKVVGTVYYDMQSSICRAGIHYGVIDNDGGWMDVTRQGRKDFFIKSYKNGLQSLGIYCPRNCLQENPHLSRVIGTKIYSDKSSICRSAIHAGVLSNESGGYVDVMPTDNRNLYISSHQNGIVSESLQNPAGGKAFRVFAVI
ncbi:Cysteine-rich secretory protein LCCL domain-containing 1 [Labeo rohita]|uniref:Cysteine-rich secretory protein LCCL domain-containing 1 n=1 Tax=Labeo rohita TaxID=84645 RepID=A0ABQ8LFG5_LABRO|nr:Cysteine-rich secretory protein LCCL domain-containing 1 [Labeo rohita]